MRLDELVGNAGARDSLRQALDADRQHHALLFTGPEGVGKRTAAIALAREIVGAGDPEEEARFDRNAHDRFLLYEDLTRPAGVRRADLIADGLTEEELLEAYASLEAEGWIAGVAPARGAGVIDLLERNPDRFTGRKGIPFADVLEKEIAALSRSRKAAPAAVEVARRLFSPGTSRAPYRGSFGIDLINGKGDGAYFRTVESLLRTSGNGWRVAVLDDAHRMTDPAENAFLKTLEEPPPRTLLILVTADPSSLLPTTVSRCARVVFDGIAPAELSRFLTGTQGVPAETAPLLVSLAEGSIRHALELRDHDLPARREFAEAMLRTIAEGDLCRALALAGKRFRSAAARERGREGERDEARLLLELVALSLRDLAVLPAAECLTPVSGMDAATVRSLAGRRPSADWERLFDRTQEALGDVNSNVEPRLAVEAMLVDAITDAAVPA